jgi:hypothetical protein
MRRRRLWISLVVVLIAATTSITLLLTSDADLPETVWLRPRDAVADFPDAASALPGGGALVCPWIPARRCGDQALPDAVILCPTADPLRAFVRELTNSTGTDDRTYRLRDNSGVRLGTESWFAYDFDRRD